MTTRRRSDWTAWHSAATLLQAARAELGAASEALKRAGADAATLQAVQDAQGQVRIAYNKAKRRLR